MHSSYLAIWTETTHINDESWYYKFNNITLENVQYNTKCITVFEEQYILSLSVSADL